jgi:hypothetical protein
MDANPRMFGCEAASYIRFVLALTDHCNAGDDDAVIKHLEWTVNLTNNAMPEALAGTYANVVPSQASAVSWGAIVAGAAAAASLSMILLMLGVGLGLSSVSPWAQSGITAATFGISTILWITFTQIAASGMGGYLAGRLRSRWVAVHTNEVYFRDTAHGFLAWAVASLATAALLTSAIGSIVGSGVQAGASLAGGAATAVTTAAAGGAAVVGADTIKADNNMSPMNYFIDGLFRKDVNAAAGGTAADTAASAPGTEVTRIFINSIRSGALPEDDLRYVGQIVAQRTGLTQADAQKHVTETFTRLQTNMRDAEVAAKNAADQGRKASAYAALWLFTALLIGAFVASLAATYGGRQRDL